MTLSQNPTPAERASAQKAALKRVRRNRRSRRIKAACAVIATLALVCAVAVAGRIALAPHEREAGAVVSTYQGMSAEEIQADLDRRASESMMTVSVNPMPELGQDGTLHINVVNDNGDRWAQRFAIIQNGETLYESGVIDPGQSVPSCSVPHAAAGEAAVQIQGLDPSTHQPKGNPASVRVTIEEAS